MKRPDGTIVTARRGVPKLAKDAYPTIFPDQPNYNYLCRKLPQSRTPPQEKEDCLQARDEAAFNNRMENDNIENYKKFCEGFSGKLNGTWMSVTKNNCATFVKFKCDVQPKITVAFKVQSNLSVVAWHENTPLDQKKLQWLLGSENKCDLWSKFESLLSYLAAYKEMSVTT